MQVGLMVPTFHAIRLAQGWILRQSAKMNSKHMHGNNLDKQEDTGKDGESSEKGSRFGTSATSVDLSIPHVFSFTTETRRSSFLRRTGLQSLH